MILATDRVMISGKEDRSRTELWKAEHLTTFVKQMSGRCHTGIAQLQLECNSSVQLKYSSYVQPD